MKKIFTFLLIAVLAITSCKKNGPATPTGETGATGTTGVTGTTGTTGGTDVYAVGQIYPQDNMWPEATIWKNGIESPLTKISLHIQSSNASSILVQKNHVYVTGYVVNDYVNHVACYWQDGILVKLTDGYSAAEATAIAVKGDDVYVVGWSTLANNRHCATIWKNTVPTYLNASNQSYTTIAYGITLNGTDVYVCGGATVHDYLACYWKNEDFVLFNSTNVDQSIAYSIVVKDNDIYAAGFSALNINGAAKPSTATIWKNNEIKQFTNTPNGSTATAFTFAGTDLYVAGYDRGLNTMYWKNDEATAIQSFSMSHGMAVVNNDIYVGGAFATAQSAPDKDYRACYWKNGARVQLNQAHQSSVNGIAVVTR